MLRYSSADVGVVVREKLNEILKIKANVLATVRRSVCVCVQRLSCHTVVRISKFCSKIKVEKIFKDSLDSILSPSPSFKIQIMG